MKTPRVAELAAFFCFISLDRQKEPPAGSIRAMSDEEEAVLSHSDGRLPWEIRDRLFVIARRILNDDHEAEDVVQETILAVWQRESDIAPEKLPHYLTRSVRQNAIKRRSRRKTHELYDDANSKVEKPKTFSSPGELEEAIEGLPTLQKDVIRLKYYSDLTFAEISNLLSISINTAASRCRYALKNLKEILK